MNTYYHLHIDLNTGISHYTNCTDLFTEWLGGTGAASKLLADYAQDPKSPLDPSAPIIFAIGPLNLLFPVITKTVALFHSPLTGNLGESHAGGRLSLAMLESQNHIISLSGKAPGLSCLIIENQKVRLEKAKSLTSFSATATERVLRNKYPGLGKRSIIRIGPAGERLSPLACATVDASRHFGRMGLGAVLGSKNLKAIVISGNYPVPLPEEPQYKKEYLKLYQTITQSSAMRKYHHLGTAMNVLPLHHSGSLPTRNFSQGFFEGAPLISGEAFAENDLSQQISCAGCPVGCIHLATHREVYDTQDYMVKSFKVAYDYELIFALGSNLSISSRSEILQLILEMERQGWDIISMGGALAWAVQAFQKGIIGKKECAGEVLRFGDGALFLRLLRYVAQKETPFFADLEKGVSHCAQKYGGASFAIHFGKVEAPGYLTGMNALLGFAIGVRHSHLDAAGYDIDLQSQQNYSEEDQLKTLYNESVGRMILNSLSACLFSRKVYTPEQILRCCRIAGFSDMSLESLGHYAHRIHGLKHAIKRKLGFSMDHLRLPSDLDGHPSASGIIDASKFNQQIKKLSSWIEQDLSLVKAYF